MPIIRYMNAHTHWPMCLCILLYCLHQSMEYRVWNRQRVYWSYSLAFSQHCQWTASVMANNSTTILTILVMILAVAYNTLLTDVSIHVFENVSQNVFCIKSRQTIHWNAHKNTNTLPYRFYYVWSFHMKLLCSTTKTTIMHGMYCISIYYCCAST